MEKNKIKRFAVEAKPAFVHYDAKSVSDAAVLVSIDDGPGRYKVSLKEGQFSHSGTPTGNATFTLDLYSGGFLEGNVVGTEPATTPEGKNSPPEITFILQAR